MWNFAKLLVTATVFVLTSCMFVVDPRLLYPPVTLPEPVVNEPSAEDAALVLCERFKLPTFRPTPLPPEFTDEQLADPNIVEPALIDYIGKLRSHARDMKQKIAKAYLEWKESCEAQGVNLD